MIDWKKHKIIKYLLITTIILINVWLLSQSWSSLTVILTFIYRLLIPFFIGFILAFVLLPTIDFLVSKKINRKISVLIVIIIIFGSITLLGIFFIPKLLNELGHFFEKIPDHALFLQVKINEILEKIPFIGQNIELSSEFFEEYLSKNVTNITGFIFSMIGSVINYIINLVLIIVTMIYFLLYFDDILKFIKAKTSDQKQEKIRKYLIDLRNTMRAYFKGVLLVCFILALVSSIAFSILGVDYAVILGLFIGVTDLIPYLGPYIGGALAFFVALASSVKKAIIVLIIIVILQSLEAYILTPKIQSKSIKTNPILVLLSLAFFGRILGIFGMFLAVPLLAFIQTTLKYLFNTQNQEN